jgi:peptidoglycan-associated lipoprotein
MATMNVIRTVLATAMGAAFLVGCASSVDLDKKADVSTAQPKNVGDNTNAGGASSGGAASNVTSVDLTNTKPQGDDAGLKRVVYFDFDSFVVKDEYRGVVEGNAKLLNTDRSKRISIEGHTDERGGREYNLALGQKRAEAVQRALTLLGASDRQIEAVSFGKERPAVSGSDEAAWAQNRRAELKPRQ